MNIIRLATRISAAAVIAAALGTSLAGAAHAGDPNQWGRTSVAGDPSQWGRTSIAGDPSQWGRTSAAGDPTQWSSATADDSGASFHRKVNEYEGQHR